jgi:hypothetical protein
MPYKLRKAPRKDLYWVVTTETGKKHSKDPIPKDKAKAQLRVLESTLKGGVSLRMPKNPNQSGEYEMRDIHGNLLEIVKTKQQALDALAVWFKFDEFYALNQILVNVNEYLHKSMTSANFKIVDELITSYKNIAEKFLSTSKNEEEKAYIREVLNTYIVQVAQEAGHPNVSVESLGQGKKKRGGMMRNPLVQPTAEQEAKAVIQRLLNSANSARAASITIPEGNKSMEKIMNEAALELAKAGKAGAVKYLNELRAPVESRDDYKKESSVERNKIARELGFTTTGAGRKLHGGIGPDEFNEITANYTDSSLMGAEDPAVVWQYYKNTIRSKLSGSQVNREEQIMSYITLAIEEMQSEQFPLEGTSDKFTVSDPTWTTLWKLLFPAKALPNTSERKGFVSSGQGKKRCYKCGLLR